MPRATARSSVAIHSSATTRLPTTWKTIDTTAYRTLFAIELRITGSVNRRAMLAVPTGVISPEPALKEKKL